MSATLDTAQLEHTLGCTTIQCAGRQFPVDIRYSNASLKTHEVPEQVSKLIKQAVQEESGSILVFLPGQKEIRQVAQQLLDLNAQDHIEVLSLYGDLSLKEQEHIIAPAREGIRKIALATSIAQTSLTIDGIRIVIDSGLSREARFDAKTATTRLHTRRASQAETIQRMGRAGRLQEGICYRWWSADQQQRLSPQSQPQIELEDLSSLVMEMARWGVQAREELDWVTLPPKAHWQQAAQLLQQLGILNEETLALTAFGEEVAAMSLPPRLAVLFLHAQRLGYGEVGASIVAMLYESPKLKESDVWSGYANLKQTPAVWQRVQQSKRQLLAQGLTTGQPATLVEAEVIGLMLAAAFPDRIAKQQQNAGEQTTYKLSNGRMATLSSFDANTLHDALVVADLGGHSERDTDQIYLSTPVNLALIEVHFPHLVTRLERCEWDKQTGRLVGEEQLWLGKLCIKRKSLSNLPADAMLKATCQFIRQQGLSCLPWDNESRQLVDRANLIYQSIDCEFKDFSDASLLEHLENWLGPFLTGITSLNQLAKLDLKQALLASLTWEQQQQLQQLTPERIKVASGSQIQVDYQDQQPVIRVKLQEMFGETQSPIIAGKAVKIELLSPAQQPLAVTMDLAFFWREVYPDVRKEMRGRYPKHPWPEDPMTAEATAKTNRALRASQQGK